MYRILIIEDEEISARKLEKMILEIMPDAKTEGVCSSVKNSVEYLMSNPSPDLIFMDIHLSDSNAFEIFKHVEVKAPVIFTTAYDEYAIKAFKVNSIDYILKPISINNLSAAIQKFRDRLQKEDQTPDLQQMILSLAGRQKAYRHRIAVQAGSKIKFFNCTDIAWFRADNKMVEMQSFGNDSFPIDQNLETLENELNPADFFRVNRKYIVNYNAIKEVFLMPKSRLKLILKPEPEDDVYVSSEKSAEVKNWLGK